MLEIKGRINTAISYAKTIEDEAVAQIRRMCDCEFTEGSKIRIMPDVHAGAGCTIGTTMTVKDKVCPNIVGVDIGCGMYTIQLENKQLNLSKIDEVLHMIPSGRNVWDTPYEAFDLKKLNCYERLKNKNWLSRSLGTLGGGNHFVEVNQDSNGTYYLVIHSGSRNLGKQVAEIYQNLAISINRGNGREQRLLKKKKIIKEYKEQGMEKDIQSALQQIDSYESNNDISIPDDLCCLHGESMKNYLYDASICQKFAKRNRELIAEIILEKAEINGVNPFHTIHNYIDTDEMILRKGAIAAHDCEKVLIPINMRDGSILGIGKGNPEWNFSAPHGAGRIMSRKKAKEILSLEEYQKTMSNVYTTSVNTETIDEAPMAYKSKEEIMHAIQDSVNIIDIIRPIYNFKSSL